MASLQADEYVYEAADSLIMIVLTILFNFQLLILLRVLRKNTGDWI